MPCYSPITLRNPALASTEDARRKRLKKKLGTRKYFEEITQGIRTFIQVPCGKCFGCMRMRCESWVFRHLLELKSCNSALFVTLTYNDEHVPISDGGMLVFDKTHVQKYFKRVRKYLDGTGIKIKYHLASEYGDTFGRPHYHALIYNYPSETQDLDKLAELWEYGNIQIGTVTEASIRYVVEYITQYYYNEDFSEENSKPFALYSRSLGGDSYEEVADYVLRTGKKLFSIDGKNYRVPSSYMAKLQDLGLISPLQYQTLTDNALSFYEKREKDFRLDCSDRGISSADAENHFIRAKDRQQRIKYELRKVGSK